MMGLHTMRQLNREAAMRSAAKKKQPYPLAEDDKAAFDTRQRLPFPYIGYWMPEGFTMTRVFFVDSSGFGRRGEPAYQIEEFLDRAVVGRFYAIVEAGQFQVHIGEFVREGDEPDEVDLSGRATYGPEGMLAEMEWEDEA